MNKRQRTEDVRLYHCWQALKDAVGNRDNYANDGTWEAVVKALALLEDYLRFDGMTSYESPKHYQLHYGETRRAVKEWLARPEPKEGVSELADRLMVSRQTIYKLIRKELPNGAADLKKARVEAARIPVRAHLMLGQYGKALNLAEKYHLSQPDMHALIKEEWGYWKKPAGK